MSLCDLPSEILHNIIHYLDVKHVYIFCLTCLDFYKNLWNDDILWKYLCLRDRYISEKDNTLTWKEIYTTCGNVSIYGNDTVVMGDEKTYELHNVGNIKAIQVSCGSRHIGIIDIHCNVYMMGFNAQGQLGLGDNINRAIPTILPDIKAKYICCGDFYTMLIDLNDNVWAFGTNDHGELGIGHNIKQCKTPQQIHNFKAKQVSCHCQHTLFLDLDNNVWGCGTNRVWELGISSEDYPNYPIKITNVKARRIAAGYHNCIIDMEYNVWIRSYNKYTKLPNIRAKYVHAGNYFTCIIDEYNVTWMFDRWDKLDNLEIQSKNVYTRGYSICITDVDNHINVVGDICRTLNPKLNPRDIFSFKKLSNIKALQIGNGDHFVAIIKK